MRLCCAVVEELFSSLEPSSTPLVGGMLEAIGSICAMSSDEDLMDEADEEVLAILKAAKNAIGAAIRKLGPQAVLSVLPLRVQVLPNC